MIIKIGTFNLNNLFSRFNFQAQIEDTPRGGGITLEFTDSNHFEARMFMGRLVKCKDNEDTLAIAQRILAMNVDVLAVQEVEHIEVLREFNRENLNGLYPHIALVEGNDNRMIDVGVMSKLPLGAITSYQAKVHPANPTSRVFSRDLVGVEILNLSRSKKLFTLYNTHLKSHFVAYGEDQLEGQRRANERRKQQAEMIAEVIASAERPNSAFVLAGDMNDSPESDCLKPMLNVEGKQLFNALQNPTETRAPKTEREGPGPQTTAWTYRHNPSGPTPPIFSLIDQIWLSDSLKDNFIASFIDRRTKHGGDGGDHDPAWIELDL